MTVTTDTHVFFLRNHFSNFTMCNIMVDGIKFSNTEQAFMYFKALQFKDFETAKQILKESNPAEAKKLGRLVKNFKNSEWEEVRYGVMLKVNIPKYNLPTFKQFLLATKDKILVECNPRDPVWGIGLSEEDPRVHDTHLWQGQNLLGKVLMEIRSTLQ